MEGATEEVMLLLLPADRPASQPDKEAQQMRDPSLPQTAQRNNPAETKQDRQKARKPELRTHFWLHEGFDSLLPHFCH